jgi:ArsR family transcriptional regulator
MSQNSSENSALTQEVNQLHAEICAALAEPRRIVLLYALAERPRTVSELAEFVGLTQSSASRHLALLRERGLVRAERRGPSVEYQLTDRRLIEALDLLRTVLRDRFARQATIMDEGEKPAARKKQPA